VRYDFIQLSDQIMNPATRILVVDDEPSILSLYTHILATAHYEVGTASTGAEGLVRARAQRPDVVLLDVMLPDVSGLEVCRQLKQDPELPDVFVALCSGLATSSAHKVDGLESGADDYLVKPVSPEELLARVRTMVRLRETTAALRASEQHYRRLVEILPDAVGMVDRHGRLRAVNPQALVMLGYATEAELRAQTIFDLTRSEDHERIRAELSQARPNQFPRNIEFTLRKQNGETIPVELSVTVAGATDREPAGFVVVARDTSRRQRSEARRAAFSRLGKELSEASTPREAAQIIVAMADELLGWDCCHVRLFSAGQDQIIPVLAYDEINGRRVEIPTESFSLAPTPMTRRVLELGAQMVNEDCQDGQLLAELTPFGNTERRCASRLFAPMRKGALQLGIVSIQSYRANAYEPEDLDLLQALADHCFGALERINFAESLRESEGRFRSLFESAPLGLALHDARGHYLNTNRAYQQMLGYSDEELRQRGVKGITWPDDITEGQRLFEELRGGQRNFYRREKRYRHRDGHVVWAESSASAVRDAGGQLRFIVSMVDDITARKQTEAEIRHLNETLEQRVTERTTELEAVNAELREKEQQLRLTLEASNAGTWSWDVGANQAAWDQQHHELYGFAPQAPITFETWIAHVHPEDRGRLLSRIEHLRQPGEGSVWNEEFRAMHPVRGERWMAGIGRVIRDDTGQLVRIFGINLDITARKRAEEAVRQLNEELEQRVRERTAELETVNAALRESELRKGAIMESALDAIITLDQRGCILEFNAAAEKIFGYNRARLLGQEFGTVIVAPALREWFGQGLACRFDGPAGPGLGSQMEIKMLRAGGLSFPAEITITRISLEGPPRFTVFIRDITEKQRTEEQIRLLADAVQSTHELVSVTDHENRFTFVNQAFREAYGYREDEILGCSPELLYAPANPKGLCDAVFQKTLAGGWHGEIINRRKDGTEFPISLSTSLIKSRTGQTVGLVGVARDIAEAKRAEKQSRAFSMLSHRLSGATTVEAAAETIMEVASVLFSWDACYVQLLSPNHDLISEILTVDTFEGRRERLAPCEPKLKPGPFLHSVLREGPRLINRSRADQPTPNLRRFGDLQRPSASLMFVPIHSDRTAVGLLSIQSYTPQAYAERDLQLLQILADHCGDALRRIEVAEALRAAEAKYRGIFENATEGIFQTTPEGRYLSANPAQARMLGYDSPAALLASVTNIEQQTYLVPAQRHELKHLFETQGQVQGFEVERVRKDGRHIWTSINGHEVRDAHGQVRYYECTSADITERKMAELELRRLSHLIIEAQETERQRVARELHDGVNQLIASAKMRLNKVADRLPELGPATREILNRCEQLLVQALEENRRIAHNLRPADLDHLGLRETCRNLCREFATHTNLKVTCRITGLTKRLVPQLELNLFRIVQEAFNNIQKHARAKSVRVAITLRDNVLHLKIQDDGRGFNSAKSHLRKKGRPGTGLSNMRERAAALGGTCDLMSAPKHGTTITVCVPATGAK
jgi:PAS domain S-box-containing protein